MMQTGLADSRKQKLAAAGGAFQVFYFSLSTLPIGRPLHRLIK
jgi:hypothetical protein